MNHDKYLLVSNIGSHAWRMQRPESDIDYWCIYQAKSTDILLGKKCCESHHTLDGNDDSADHELGHVVQYLLDGNFNFLVGVLTPLIIKDWDHRKELQELTLKNISKLCYKSAHGLAVGNYNKYIRDRKESPEKVQKRMNTICRSLKFAIYMLETGKPRFEPFWNATDSDVLRLIKEIDEAHTASPLPDEPRHRDEFEAWLLKLRLENLPH